ncbi:MAG: SDR family NAD(P)-dependent oxidoreductase [Gemmataceae bacterium]
MAARDCQLPPYTLAALTPPGADELALLTAAARAGGLPLLDAARPASASDLGPRAAALRAAVGDNFGIRTDADGVPGLPTEPVDLLLLAGAIDDLPGLVGQVRPWARRVFREVVNQAEAEVAIAAGVDGLVARGNECGGRVGSETTFVLLQRLVRRVKLPIWVQGGLSPSTFAACLAGGASGAVLDSQLALAEEADLPEALRGLLQAMDGTETVCLGESLGLGYRVHKMRAAAAIRELQELENHCGDATSFTRRLRDAGRRGAVWDQPLPDGRVSDEALWPVGQEAAFAARLATRHRNVAGILRAYRQAATDNIRLCLGAPPFAEGSPFARARGTRYPIFQGPMTRVSDVAPFADAVAKGGALPFLALALLREPDARKLLDETATLLGDQPWGVGLLAFLPPELRAEQTRAVLAVKPKFAILAGGRPDQARELDAAGVTTFLHTPSPRLLEMFLKDGARRFVFEGRECGGHVGPLSSFLLWDSALDVLLRFRETSNEPIDVLFAGGIHDGRSAAMVAALAAPAVAANIRVGVLMGTAYLFTHEALSSGAIVPEFQRRALASGDTVLLDAQGGHAIRCAPTDYAGEFNALKRSFLAKGLSPQEARERLEEVNIGRLRIASKGVRRTVGLTEGPPELRGRESHLVPVGVEEQRREGMYMMGSVGALRDGLGSIDELHRDVCEGSAALLQKFAAPPVPVLSEEPIAVIGMGCVFPDAPDLERYWSNILRLHNAIREVPPERWKADHFYSRDPMAPDRVVSKWGGFFAPVPFDPMRYGIPPASIPSIEPMQLLVLENSRTVIEHAGYHKRPFPRERTAVIIGAGGGACDLGLQYQTRALVEHYLTRAPGVDPAARDQVLRGLRQVLPALTEDSFAGTLCNVAAGRVANRFDLTGPNFAVDAACASSLAALDMAVLELRQRSSDVVFLGGGDAQMNISSYLMFSKTHALSPRGRCRPFDANADGIAISEGLAGVILKRLDEAVRDGDTIYAVLRSVGSSSDGRDKSMTAPSPLGQRRTLERAYALRNLSPATVGLVEAHGTGTVVGDRTELQSLCDIFGAAGAKSQSCALGSVKSQIGHTKNGAGLAGLIKAVLALHHRTLPPTLVEEPGPAVRDRSIPFYLNTRARPWFHTARTPRRAAVSAFGFGGTNFHVVLEEYAGHASALIDRPCELFLFRAASRNDLVNRLQSVEKLLANSPTVRKIDVAALLQREAAKARGDHRGAIVAADLTELRTRVGAAIQSLKDGKLPHSGPIVFGDPEAVAGRGKVAFLFPGQGSQHLNMLEELALYFPQVRETFEEAESLLDGVLPQPLTQVIFPPPAYSPQEEAEQRKALDQTWWAQPALGAADFALFRLLRHLGVEPDHLAGHSYGEYVALCAAGAISFADLMRLSERRGRIVQDTQGREAVGMLAVQASLEKLGPVLQKVPGLGVAACNAPEQTVLGGTAAAIDAAAPLLEQARIGHQRLAVSAGFHIPEARPAAKQFAAVLAEVPLEAPRRPVWSNRTAGVYPSEAATMRQLLEEHLTEPVRFRSQVEAMADAGCRTFVEVGPGQVLSGLARLTLGEGATVLATNRRGPGGAMAGFLEAVGRLWANGVPVRGERLFHGCAVRPLEMSDLGKGEPTLPPTTWLLDGGSARPLKERAAPAKPLAQPKPKAAPSPAPPPRQAPTPPVQQPPAVPKMTQPVPVQPTIPVSSPPAAVEVMNAFQASMRHFLDYQAKSQEQRQVLMQQFLHTQASIVQAFLTGQPAAALPEMPAMPVMATLPPVSLPAPAAYAPPPAPVVEAAHVAEPTTNGVAHDEPATKAANELLALPAGKRAEKLEGLLLELVSDRTGYPQEMLELDHNMEADLGIDSIKRTEIFGGLRDRLGFEGESYENEEYYIKLGKLRTLREVLSWLNEEATPDPTVREGLASPDTSEPLPNGRGSEGGVNGEAKHHPAMRFTLEVTPAPLLDPGKRPEREREVILVTDGPAGRARKLFTLLRGLDYDLAFVRHGTEAKLHSAGNYEVDLLSAAGMKQLRSWIEQHHGVVTSVCHLLPLDPAKDLDPAQCLEARSLFHLMTTFGLDLVKGKGTVIGVTGLGGSFGVGEPAGDFRAGAAAVLGFLKSLAREWQDVHVKVIDVDPSVDDPQLLGQIVSEFRTTDRKVEVGYGPNGRQVIDVREAPVERSPEPMIELDEESVVLMIGGARGITAAIAAAIARRYRSRLVLVGRSPAPEPETAETKGVTSAADLKRAIADRRRRRGEPVTPAAVEGEYRAILAARELQASLDQLAALGSPFSYHPLDVRDDAAFTAFLRSLYEQYGRIDGVVHAAGLLGDSLLLGKTAEGYDRIFDTKVKPALTLIRELHAESLKFLVFFSSVSARFGNIGQTDYAAGNEMLNKLAGKLDHDWAGRVVSVGWGPWDEVGMARPEKMSAEYLAAVGFAHMPVAEGCEMFLDEIAYGHKGESEVLIFSPLGDGPSENSYSEAQFYLRAGKR